MGGVASMYSAVLKDISDPGGTPDVSRALLPIWSGFTCTSVICAQTVLHASKCMSSTVWQCVPAQRTLFWLLHAKELLAKHLMCLEHLCPCETVSHIQAFCRLCTKRNRFAGDATSGAR